MGFLGCERERYFRETPHLSVTPGDDDSLYEGKDQELYLVWNVVKIQAWWRSRCCVQRLNSMRQAAQIIQAAWGRFHASEKTIKLMTLAAQKIQRCWQSYRDRKIFKYFRDLITSNEKLHPTLLLRRINPSEAALADSATGLHIRFRLGGTSFPPSMLYKLYTHRPVVDMGAFSPRKYSVSLRRPLTFCPRRCFEHPVKQEIDEYVRCENNGWRLVCDTGWLHNMEEVIPEKKEPIKIFYPSLTARREHKAQESRKKKRAWLHKLYNDGRLADMTSTSVTQQSSDMVGTDDERAMELFVWSLGLNFDSYEADWSNLATSCVVPSYEFHNGEPCYI